MDEQQPGLCYDWFYMRYQNPLKHQFFLEMASGSK